MDNKKKGIIAVLLSAIIFGCMPLGARLFYAAGGNAESLVFYRNALAVFPLMLLAKKSSQKIKVESKKDFLSLLLLTAAAILTPLLLFASYRYIPTGMATTLHFIYPVFVLIGMAVFYKEKITRKQLMCTALCTVGICMLYTPGSSVGLLGVLFAFCSGITYAFYAIWLDKSGLEKIPCFALAFWQTALGSVFLLVACGGKLQYRFQAPIWILLLVFALMVSVGAVVLFQIGVRYIGSQQTSILSTFEPLTSIVVGVGFFAESITLRTGLGLVFILLAVVLLTMSKQVQKVD